MKSNRKNSELDLTICGYSSRLFSRDELDREEAKYLIPWQDDENLLIDRYDCRVYLQDLSEKTIGSATNVIEDEFTDKIEEELCETERYLDLKALKKRPSFAEKPREGAEIIFNYDNNDGLSEDESEEEKDDEPYKPPEGLKLPVGINMPPTMKLGHIIERTANFVATQGSQMEIIIKAKHSKHRDRLNFLQFDHPLNSFYKVVCKLIREKKYVPPPTKPKHLPGEHVVQPRPENHNEDSASDSDDGDYLHPLLTASKSRPNTDSPIPLPVVHNKLNPYSSLYDNLVHSADSELIEQDEPTTSKEKVVKEPTANPESKPNFETDLSEVHNYNIWHQSFYGRPSIFLPNAPPRFKIPPTDIISQINVAARFVAGNGAFSERNLMEHNKGRLNFLFPNSDYLIYYHSKVRFFQSRLNAQVPAYVHSKYHKSMMDSELLLRPASQPPPPSQPKQNLGVASFDQTAIPPAPKPPEPIKTTDFPNTDFKVKESSEEIKRKRKERAQQFMANIIKRKKSIDDDQKIEESVKSKPDDDLVVPADAIVPSLINTLVSGQLEKLKTITKPSNSNKTHEKPKERKRKHSRSREHRRLRSKSRERSRRSRSRSPRRHKRYRSRTPRRRSPSYDESSEKKRRRRRSRS